MWLLDHNLPRQLLALLKSSGISVESVHQRKWEFLENGDLVEIAVKKGFDCILTKDVRFEVSSKKAFNNYPDFCIVLIRIPQAPGDIYCERFLKAWQESPIQPIPGQVVVWPTI